MSIETHASHCCVLHGCKYSDPDCPVVKREIKQECTCEMCDMEDIEEIPNPDDPDFDVSCMDDRSLCEELIRLRKANRTLTRHVIAVRAVDAKVRHPLAAQGEDKFYAYFKDDEKQIGSYGANIGEAVGYLVSKSVLKEPFVVEKVIPE